MILVCGNFVYNINNFPHNVNEFTFLYILQYISARVKVRQIKEADFKKWKYQAMSKRDGCTNGIITPEEFTEWMENSFPNRKPKGRKKSLLCEFKQIQHRRDYLLYRNLSWDKRLQYQNGIILHFESRKMA
ncbi:MAG: hypothetical protein IJN34_06955 [Clostridia bacterium]|nr:hypothetical protein [Clostridia bacterium]